MFRLQQILQQFAAPLNHRPLQLSPRRKEHCSLQEKVQIVWVALITSTAIKSTKSINYEEVNYAICRFRYLERICSTIDDGAHTLCAFVCVYILCCGLLRWMNPFVGIPVKASSKKLSSYATCLHVQGKKKIRVKNLLVDSNALGYVFSGSDSIADPYYDWIPKFLAVCFEFLTLLFGTLLLFARTNLPSRCACGYSLRLVWLRVW